MTLPVLVIVNGAAATGKTTIGRRLAHELALPFASKDMFKETLFDTLGWNDRAWSKQIGRAGIALLFQFMETQLAARRSCIVECNFKSELATPEFLALRERHAYQPVQILCRCDGNVLFERFRRRAESGERHPGHVDHVHYDEFAPSLLRGYTEPLDIGGRLIEVDTTDWESVDYGAIIATIRQAV
jgi:predicted kinase